MFKNENRELAGYAILKNKKIILTMDLGESPRNNFSKFYQSGALSFEIFSNGKKLITNSGYFSNNQNKLNEVNLIFKKFKIISLVDLNFNEEIAETADSFHGNALLKAKHIYDIFKQPVFADDSGLEVFSLNGAPGIYSARYAGNEKNHKKNNEKLLKVMKDKSNNKAQFKTVVAYVDDKSEYFFEGIVSGSISNKLKGSNGFGYDPLFIPKGFKKTFGELPMSVKLSLSHRSIAIEKLNKHLNSLT